MSAWWRVLGARQSADYTDRDLQQLRGNRFHSMHCPGCGNESSLDQKFCRKCGFNLEPISKLLIADKEPDQVKLSKAERESLVVRHMFRWMSWGGIVLLIGVA